MNRLDSSLLSPLPMFSDLSRDQIRQVLDLAEPRRYDAGSTIFREGDPAEHFFLLLDGYVRAVRITQDGVQVVALHISSGQLLGIARAIGKTRYPASAIAVDECLVLAWPMAHWDTFVELFPSFARNTYATVGRRMGELNDRIVEMSTLHVEQRVARTLVRLIEQAGRQTDKGIQIDFPITRQDLSEMAGTTLHTASRLLSSWEKSGIVESQRKQITVCDPKRMVTFADQGPS